ncbi:secretagogin-like isoform 1-T1 [Odontesthes bonariensis]|uniref:secretagogin-like isoform X1 n=1 Tax=Odontesthes bonariensis TaxID=219752 RepID=UPI003F58A5FB
MDAALERLDAAGFLQIWQHLDKDDNGYIEGKELDAFFKHMLQKLGMKKQEITEDKIRGLRERFVSDCGTAPDGRLQIQELATVMLPEEENFLLLFRRETPLDNSVEFMRIWRNYDADSSGYISANELKGFLQDLFLQHRKSITPEKLEEYTDTMMKMFDKNRDGRLDLNDLARYCHSVSCDQVERHEPVAYIICLICASLSPLLSVLLPVIKGQRREDNQSQQNILKGISIPKMHPHDRGKRKLVTRAVSNDARIYPKVFFFGIPYISRGHDTLVSQFKLNFD